MLQGLWIFRIGGLVGEPLCPVGLQIAVNDDRLREVEEMLTSRVLRWYSVSFCCRSESRSRRWETVVSIIRTSWFVFPRPVKSFLTWNGIGSTRPTTRFSRCKSIIESYTYHPQTVQVVGLPTSPASAAAHSPYSSS